MLWRGRRESENVEDIRGAGGGRGLPGGAVGIGGIGTVIVVLVSMYFGVDPSVVLNGLQGASNSASSVGGRAAQPGQAYQQTPEEAETRQFVGVVLAETEETWRQIFAARNATYENPKLVLFTDAVRSACGTEEAAVGPFYCAADRKVYIDLSFYRELRERFGAPGDFAEAYVIAHEIGHHVQNLLGTSQKVSAARERMSKVEANALSVRVELQADCYAGVWAHYEDSQKKLLEPGDVDEAMTAAAAIGDDHLQMQAQGRVSPDSFTHGTSQQRQHWFKRGMSEGKLEACNTFADNT